MNESSYRFDSFVVDFSAREFVRDGERIHLQEQPFQLLVMLLERSNQVVTREELRRRLWPANVLVDFDHRIHGELIGKTGWARVLAPIMHRGRARDDA